MSRISSGSGAETAASIPPSAAAGEVQLAFDQPTALESDSVFQNTRGTPQTSNLGEVHSRQLVLDTTCTATELALGKVVSLSDNLTQILSDGVSEAVDENKIIVTGIELCNVYSDVPKRVTVGINLFDSHSQKQGLNNGVGWLYSQTSSDLAENEHVSFGGDDGSYTNLCSLLPNERARHQPAASLYTPTHSTLTSRHMVDYNGITQVSNICCKKHSREYYFIHPAHTTFTSITNFTNLRTTGV